MDEIEKTITYNQNSNNEKPAGLSKVARTKKRKTIILSVIILTLYVALTAFFIHFAKSREKSQKNKSENSASNASSPSVPDIEFVYVAGGTFQMGSNDGLDDEKPVHSVTVSSFYIGKYEVTQEQWRAVMGNNPSYFKGDNLPVESVNWNDVQTFIRKLNQMTGKTYRLPTEAEWEYAAGGGSNNRTKWAGTNSENVPDSHAWYVGNSNSKTHPVGTRNPNRLGIYDMSGNVWEWCSDWYASDYYNNSPQNNPKGPSGGAYRMSRGGSWSNLAFGCRVAYRYDRSADFRSHILGLRLVFVP